MARQPFFGRGPGPAIARMDMNAATAPGRAYGQMFANMGKQIGDTIQQYQLNKQKRDESEAAFRGKFGRITEQPDGAEKILAMQNDPVIGPTLKRIQEGKGTQPDFDKFNAFTSADTEQEIQLMKKRAMESDIATKLLENENRKLRNQIGVETKDDVVAGVGADTRRKKAQAGIAETDEAYQKTDKALGRENIQSQIDYRDAATLSMLFKQNNINAPVPQDLEKRYSEIMSLMPKLDNTKIKVKTTGTFGTGFNAEEKEIPYSEYKENPDDYAPLVTDQLKGLQLQENALKEELSQLTLSTPIPYTNDDTGAQGMTTVREMLKFQTQSKNNTPTNPQSMPLGQEDMMMLDQPGTTIGVPQVPNFSR
jgi:hypothetical protein